MRIGGFTIDDPVPDFREPYVVAGLRPWIDVNNVGTLVLNQLESMFGAREIGRLTKPGLYYDFTRYRPTIDLEEGIRDLSVPNTTVHYAAREGSNGIILLRLLEPHANAEHYVRSVVKLLKTFKARKYILLGSMYDMVPHTRPLIVSGYGMGAGGLQDVRKAGALPITYNGPSTMANMITKEAADWGIDAAVFIVSLPQYVVLEEDCLGKVRLLEILNRLYDIPVAREELEKAAQQRDLINERAKASTEVKTILPQLESAYDVRMRFMGPEDPSRLSPEIEAMLWKITGDNVGKA
jgi:predicted ATP-grasp superfamily ATP-dependent carboligase